MVKLDVNLVVHWLHLEKVQQLVSALEQIDLSLRVIDHVDANLCSIFLTVVENRLF
jgi:hypothetical protein